MHLGSFAHSLSAFRSLRTWLRADGGFNARLLGSSSAGVGIIVLLAVVFLMVTGSDRRTERLRDATLEILHVADKAENDLTDLENTQRDFLFTGQPQLLAHLQRRRAALASRLKELTVLAADHPEQLAVLAPLRESMAFWETQIGDAPTAVGADGRDAATLGQHERSMAYIEGIRVALGKFTSHQTGIFNEATERAARSRVWEIGGFGILSFLAIGFFVATSGYSYRAFKRHLHHVENAQARTRLIVDTTLDGVLTTDDAGIVQLANPAAERMFGAHAKSLVGRRISELIPHRAFAAPFTQCDGTVTADGRRLDPPHAAFPVEISLSEMTIDTHRQHVALVRDITERRRNEEALRHIGLGVGAATGEEFVKSFVAELSIALQLDCAFLVELDGHGPGAVTLMTIAEQGTIRSTGPCDLTHTACREALTNGFMAWVAGARKAFPNDWLLASFDAQSFVAMPLVDAAGSPNGLIGVVDRRPMERVEIVENTLKIFAARAAAELERKRYERDLAAEKERLAVTLRSIGDGCITIDNDGRVLLMNPVAEKLTGWTHKSAAGQQLGEVFHVLNERTRRPCRDAMKSLIETGSAAEIVGATVILARDGTERVIETNASPIRDTEERKMGVVLVFRDVTERHRIIEERQKAEKLDSLGVAAGGIAHDFNNLLTAILGNLSLALFDPKLCASTSEHLAGAKKASLRAQELSQQLLTFAKGGAPIKQTSSVAQLVRDTVGFSLRGSNVRSECTIPDDLWPADIDPGQISQVIQNLTINADQAMPAGGTLRVTCTNLELPTLNIRLGLAPGRYLKITVQDEGIGISEEHISKIFDPYFTTKPKGSGLGLATAYSIIRNHGGVIEVTSLPGEGTCFYIYLPASEKPLVVPRAPADTMDIKHRPARILVLDDEDAICALVTCALEPYGYEVVETYDALTALARYEEALRTGRRFDLVISDLTIPGGMGGQECVRRLRAIDPTVRAIVSSGYAMDPVMAKFRDHGFCAMIAKPYEIAALARVVAEVLAENVIAHDFANRKTA
jgi:PAS domain S-box-containing protein